MSPSGPLPPMPDYRNQSPIANAFAPIALGMDIN
jgi:hypothetical protein